MSKLTSEQNERMSALIEQLTKKWGPIVGPVPSERGLYGSFVNIPGDIEAAFKDAGAKIGMSYVAPQRTGSLSDMHILSGAFPFQMQFIAKARPAITDGNHNVEINLYPALVQDDNDGFLREALMELSEDLLGAELITPEGLAYFVKRQLDRSGVGKRKLLAEIAVLLSDELHAEANAEL